MSTTKIVLHALANVCPSESPEARAAELYRAVDVALDSDDRCAAGDLIDEHFRVARTDRRGTDVHHRRGRYDLVTNNGQDRLVRG